jgi:hypothetical protein
MHSALEVYLKYVSILHYVQPPVLHQSHVLFKKEQRTPVLNLLPQHIAHRQDDTGSVVVTMGTAQPTFLSRVQ